MTRPPRPDADPNSNAMRVIGSVSTGQGGTATVAIELEREFEALHLGGCLLATDVDAGKRRLAVELRVPIRWRGVVVLFDRSHPPTRFKTSLPQALRIWRTSKVTSVIHAHELYACSTVAAWASARRWGIPLILQPHGVLDPLHRAKSRIVKGLFSALVGRRILRDSFAIVCASDAEATEIASLGYPQTRTIPHGVRLEQGSANETMRKQLQTLDARTVVLSLGRLAKKKNPDLLIRAWALAKPIDATLILAGPDDYWTRAQLLQMAAELEVSESVAVWPVVDGTDKTAVLARADLFVLPSSGESFGLTVPEAMVAGTACIVSAEVATAHHVHAAGAGEVMADLDARNWAVTIARLVAQPAHIARMGEQAAKYSADRFSWPKAAAQYADLYAEAGRSARC